MDQTQLRIRAKKISELEDFISSNHDIATDGDEAYVILAYTKNGARENYKISLSRFITELNNSTIISEEYLREKIIQLFEDGSISLPSIIGPAGPQGPQGPAGEGANVDLTTIQQELDRLQSLIDVYHNDYPIEYALTNISPDPNNPNYIRKNETITLNFIPSTGWKMPSTAIVIGASEFTYNSSSGSIYINGVNENVNKITVQLSAERNKVRLIFSLNHITYEYLSTVPTDGYFTNYYNNIEIKLTAENLYSLPNTVSVSNASINSYDPNTGILNISCTGIRDMIVSASAEYINNTTYYYCICAKGVDDNGILEYNSNEDPIRITAITSKFVYGGNSCPINYNERIISYDNTLYDEYGDEEVYLILPSKYFDETVYKFKDDSGNLYNLQTGDMPITINSSHVFHSEIGGVPYSIIQISPSGLMVNYIIFKKV